MNKKNRKLVVRDEYTLEIFEKLIISKDIIDNDEITKIKRQYDYGFILYNPKLKKIFKEFRKDGTPIFTEKFKYAKIMDVGKAYSERAKIFEFVKDHPTRKYLKNICKDNEEKAPNKFNDSINSFDIIYKSDLHVCIIEFDE